MNATPLPLETQPMHYTLAHPCAHYEAFVLRVRIQNTTRTAFYAIVISPKKDRYNVTLVFENPQKLLKTECDCPSMQHRKFSRTNPYATCKHILALLHALSGTSQRFEQHWRHQLAPNPDYRSSETDTE